MSATPEQILRSLRDRDLEDLAAHAARRYGCCLDEIIGCSRELDIVEARHAAWYALYKHFGGNASAVARLWGTDPSTIAYALADWPGDIVRVVLLTFPNDERPWVELVWVAGRQLPFGVLDTSPLQSSAEWYATHEEARAMFIRRTEEAGATTFRAHSVGLSEGGS